MESKDKDKKEVVKKKFYFDVVVEAMTPMTIKYRVFAEDVDEAMKIIKAGNYQSKIVHITKPKIIPQLFKSISVYIGGTISKLLSIKL